MKKRINLSALLLFTLLLIQCNEYDNDDTVLEQEPAAITVTDADGNVYRTITIGNQTWMLENLKTTKFNDGTSITEYPEGEHWNKDARSFPFYQWASTADLNNDVDEDLPFDFYGAMYNHAAIESGKLAPEGWRIPTQQDFEILKNFIASQGYADREGEALKSISGWNEFSGNGLDALGFNALPGGYVDAFGTPKADSIIGTWATSDYNAEEHNRVILSLHQQEMEILDQSILIGASIRCIKN